jgi:hypothetical protein
MKWVDVDNEMPDIDQEVLILIPVANRSNIENGVYRGNGVFSGAWCTRRGEGQSYKVSHWMPRPKLPIEQGE